MKLTYKLLGVTIVAQVVFALTFFAAVYFSYTSITESIQKTSLRERFTDDALDIYVILHLADTGDEAGVRESLNLKLDNYIYEIHQLSPDQSGSNTGRIAELMRNIAKHRDTYPREAENVLQKDVDGILAAFSD